MAEKALIAMSGGVDSSLAAKLMTDTGFQCIGCTMKLHDNEDIGLDASRTCCTLDDAEAARGVAAKLGIPFYVFQFREEFESAVIRRFAEGYEGGRTPNPCIDCNRYLKFGRLLRRADELGCRYLVTGHYAQIEEANGRFLLKKAADAAKDQTYFLACLTQAQISRAKFPLGGLTKAEVRELARQAGFVNADKRDSQDICFVPDGDYAAFLERRAGRAYPPGDFLDRTGRVVGRHRGAVRYTLGQRRGLNLAMGAPVYVCAKNMADNTVTVGPEEVLYANSLVAEDLNWLPFAALDGSLRVSVKTRYSQREQPATVRPLEDGRVRVDFDAPQRAVTPGQAVVMYDGDLVVGAGTIVRAPA